MIRIYQVIQTLPASDVLTLLANSGSLRSIKDFLSFVLVAVFLTTTFWQVGLVAGDRLEVLKQQILQQSNLDSPQCFPLYLDRFPTQVSLSSLCVCTPLYLFLRHLEIQSLLAHVSSWQIEGKSKSVTTTITVLGGVYAAVDIHAVVKITRPSSLF